MSIAYKWDIQSLHVVPSLGDDGYNNIVKEVYWSLTAVNERLVSSFISDCTTLDIFCDKSNFINYSDLSEDVVISWIHQILGEEKINEMKTNLENKIQSLIDYPTVIFSLPWIEYLPKESIDLGILSQLLPESEQSSIEPTLEINNAIENDDPYGIFAQAKYELENESLLN